MMYVCFHVSYEKQPRIKLIKAEFKKAIKLLPGYLDSLQSNRLHAYLCNHTFGFVKSGWMSESDN